MNIQTADLCDAHEDKLAVVAPMFASYGGRPSFGGPIATLKIFEDNSFVRKALEGPGNGRVLVIDGGASMRCALVGDQLAELAVKNGWAGILVYGCIRDSKAIGEMDLASSPSAPTRRRPSSATSARLTSRWASAASPSSPATTSTPTRTAWS